jgi:hypothetical protein
VKGFDDRATVATPPPLPAEKQVTTKLLDIRHKDENNSGNPAWKNAQSPLQDGNGVEMEGEWCEMVRT